MAYIFYGVDKDVVCNAKTKTRNMTLNSFKLILILGLLTESAMAQSLKTDSVTNAKVPMPITISYYSNLIVDPGFKVGIERPFLIIQKSKIRKNGKLKFNRLQFLNTLNLGYYYTKEQNHSPFLNMEIGYRKIRKSGFKTEAFLGLGYMRTILTDETYKVDNNGNVSKIDFAGSNYFMPSLSFGIGYDNSYRNDHFPFSVSLKPNIFFRLPYNHSVLTNIGMELNLSYQIGSFRSKSKQIFKSK